MVVEKCGFFRGRQMVVFRCRPCHHQLEVEQRRLERLERLSSGGYGSLKRRDTREMTDAYVRKVLSSHTTVPMSAWPEWLVELKRAHLTLKRVLLRL